MTLLIFKNGPIFTKFGINIMLLEDTPTA